MFDELVEVVETRRPVLSPRHRYGDPDAGIDSWWDVRAVPFGDGYLLAARDVAEAVLAEHAAEERRVAERSERLALGLLQQLGLPAALPVPAGLDVAARYRPADTDLPVGGDWYDVVELADGGCCLVVGDVAGHGVGAVDAMVRLRHALTAYALDDESPDRVLARARRVARREALFATCLLARFDPVRRHLVYARAGHLPAVLVRDGAAVLLDAAVTPPLSASTWAGGERSAHVPVRPGDVLVLYTDGLIERRGEPLDTSLAGLAAFVSGVRGSASEVCEAVVAWAGRSGTPFTDDFCLVVAAVS
jgi:serine phosphatase RsbU (regulator of sigma subunit)